MQSECEYCGAPLPHPVQPFHPIVAHNKPARGTAKSNAEQMHRITTTGPNGTFVAEFTHEEWMDRRNRDAINMAARTIHRQAGHEWELRL